MTELVYTKSQMEGWDKFASFYLDPNQTVFQLKGAAGTGKSTLIQMLLMRLPQLDRMRKLVDTSFKGLEVVLTATTNQAALSLKEATGTPLKTKTIHSAIGVRPHKDYATGITTLMLRKGADKLYDSLVIIDEASYVDQELLNWIFTRTERCKFVFVGDPNQLTPVTSSFMPVFAMSGESATLTDLVRFDDGPLIKVVSDLRDTVETGTWHKIEKHEGVIEHVDNATFLAMAEDTFRQKGKGVSKILAYHNAAVNSYNDFMASRLLGTSQLMVGQRVISNKASSNRTDRLFANEEVMISKITPFTYYDIEGAAYEFEGKTGEWFMPRNREDIRKARATARDEDDWTMLGEIDEEWADLRHAWSCTVNKSQGSTYDTAFIDLTDISKGSRTANQLARLLYVGLGRARSRIVMTGDIV